MPLAQTKAASAIAISLRTGAGANKTIGYIQSLSRTYNRRAVYLRQIEAETAEEAGTDQFVNSEYSPGETVEIVPGGVDNEKITIRRAALYSSLLFEAFMRTNQGETNANDTEKPYVSLIQQIKPVQVYEMFFDPTTKKIIRGYHYKDCWFESESHEVNVTGDVTIIQNASLAVTRTRPYYGG